MQNMSYDYVNNLPLVLPLPSQREQTIVFSSCNAHVYCIIFRLYIFFLHQACPFLFEIFTQECDGEVEILPMALSSKHVDSALCQLARGCFLTGTVRGEGKDVVAYLLVTSHLTTIVIENKVNEMKWHLYGPRLNVIMLCIYKVSYS